MRRAAPVLLVALLGLAAAGYVHDPRKLKKQKRAEARGDAWGDEWALRRKAKLNSLLRALHAVAVDHTDVVLPASAEHVAVPDPEYPSVQVTVSDVPVVPEFVPP